MSFGAWQPRREIESNEKRFAKCSGFNQRVPKYKPDFGLRINRKVRWIVEAKAPTESLDEHEWQPRAYSVLLNGVKAGDRPVRYYLLTNGEHTRLYDPDINDPLIRLRFSDFVAGNKKFEKLREFVGRDNILDDPPSENVPKLKLEKKSLAEVNAAFAWCHQQIYRKDNISQSDAFSEFVKLIALKLISDRAIRDKYPTIHDSDSIEVPLSEVTFSLPFIELHERTTPNPINDILFKGFMDDLEQQIAKGQRRRIFEERGRIDLNPETIRGVVKKLQDFFLFGIDADLNGRLFETFLNATMRGKDLGQFFTPRSVVELGVGLAQIKVGTPRDGKTETVIDACCGTGGFLIDALADMWEKADKKVISDQEKHTLRQQIANNHIIGIDVANAPKLARIARLNMYLHGDGGSRIFHLNALDKDIPQDRVDQPEIVREKQAFRDLIESGEIVDVALTNPPFAKAMERTTEGEKRILDQYEIGRVEGGSRGSVRSCLLFAERYHDLLRVGGRLVTVIDDGILSGDEHKWFRDKLREWFIIRAVVSLPGDAFQRSNARVKTSYLVAEKRDPDRYQEQPPVFMYPCQYVGIDDAKRQRARPGDDAARQRAIDEVEAVVAEYEAFQSGEATRYAVAAERVLDRLDVKNCMMTAGRAITTWEEHGFDVLTFESVLEPREYAQEDIITKDYPYPVRVLIVRYEGLAEGGEEIMPSDSSYARLYPVRTNDIVISNIAATHGSIAIVPENLDGCVVSNE